MIEPDQQLARVDGAFVPAPAPNVVAVAADGEAVLVDEANDLLHLLNASGALLWECFDGSASIAETSFDIADELGVPFERVLADAMRLAIDLVSVGLVRDGRDDAAAAPDEQTVPPRPRLLDEPPGG